MTECNGRPHWAKAHKLRRPELEALYPKYKDFLSLRSKLDPNNRFMNDYLNNIF